MIKTAFIYILSASFLKRHILTSATLALALQSLAQDQPRQRISINEDWKFFKYKTISSEDTLIYDVRPEIKDTKDDKPADAKPTEAVKVVTNRTVLKQWILPTGNSFIKDPAKRHKRPEGNPGSNFPFVQPGFDDSSWETVTLPHDWAIKGPFYKGWDTEIGGGMGRLPSQGIAWYRKTLNISQSDAGKNIFLDVEGAMSYAMVWLNGKLVGGWPYGYTSWRVDLSPYIIPGAKNQLAIRIDNPLSSSRWYPGGGIYRNIWLTKTNPVHVSQWGTYVKTENVSKASAKVVLQVAIDNNSNSSGDYDVSTEIYLLDSKGQKAGKPAAKINATRSRGERYDN